MSGAGRRRLDSEILTLRICLAGGGLPPGRRELLERELADLRLARVGVRTRRIRSRLASLGIEGKQETPRRGPEQWGELVKDEIH